MAQITYDDEKLTFHEAQYALRCAIIEKEAARQKGWDIQWDRLELSRARLRRQGFSEEYIKLHA